MNRFTFAGTETWSPELAQFFGATEMTYTYDGFDIESFEAGKGLWHARIKRADLSPVVLDGVLFPTLEVGFAWSDPDAAIADAKAHIDRFRQRDSRRSPAPQV